MEQGREEHGRSESRTRGSLWETTLVNHRTHDTGLAGGKSPAKTGVLHDVHAKVEFNGGFILVEKQLNSMHSAFVVGIFHRF